MKASVFIGGPMFLFGSACSLQGRRNYQEDTFQAVSFTGSGSLERTSLAAVYDGHGGGRASRVARDRLHLHVQEMCEGATEYSTCLAGAFAATEQDYKNFTDEDESPELTALRNKRDEGREGSTACVALINETEVVVANSGDSRCVLCRNGRAYALSEDHKPDDAGEYKRIRGAGWSVSKRPGGCYRIYRASDDRIIGGLNLSRAIGDFVYGDAVTCEPDVRHSSFRAGDVLILGTDGLWDVVSNAHACALAREHRGDAADIARVLVDKAVELRSGDNVTSVVVYHNGGVPPEEEKEEQLITPAQAKT